jgi:DNA polymerase I
MYIDQGAWRQLAKTNKAIADRIAKSLPFNPASPKQTLEALRKAGCKRLASTDAKDMKDHADNPLVKKVMEFRNYAKMAGTYGENFLEMVEEDGRIHAAFRVCGAETGRLSSSNPNFQNIPARKGTDFRFCFTAPTGRRLIIADYSQQEPRINAYLAHDQKMISLFKAGGDIYINVAKEVFGETITKADPRRKKLKSVILGLSYGLSYKGLAVNEGISEEEAQLLIQRYLATFPAQREHVERTRNTGNDFVRTVAGRKMYINHYSYQWQNNVLNAPVQGGAADCSKVALVDIEKGIQKKGYDARIVNFVHDEVVVEVSTKDARAVAKIVHDCMVKAAEEMFVGVPFAVDISIGNRWSDKK